MSAPTVPAEWAEVPLRRVILKLEQGWSPIAEERPAEEGEWGVLKLSAVKRGRFCPDAQKALGSTEPRSEYEVKPGDVLMTRANTPELVGDICIVNSCPPRLMLSDLIYRIALNQERVDPRYFVYWFLGRAGADQVRLDARGASRSMVKISQEHIKSWRIALPPISAQRAIASYLDRKIASLDALIEGKQQLIALLTEQQEALTHHAVTKGINPNLPMKSLPIPWIGEIPAHWEITRARFLCDITTGSRDTQDSDDAGEYPFFVRSDTVERISTWSFDGEGVLTSGDGAGVGKNFHYCVGKFEVHQRVYLFYKFRKVLGRFFFYFLRSNLHKVVLAGTAKSTVESLRRPMLQDFPIVYGSEEDQRCVISYLDEENRQFGCITANLGVQLDRLREYRQALIDAVVTGQLDVGELTT